MTGRGIAKAFALLVNVYGARFDIPADPDRTHFKTQIWAELLVDIPDDRGLAAFSAYCKKHGDWPPTPAHILDLANVNLRLPAPGEAWSETWDTACHKGYCEGSVPAMSHPEIRAAAASTPWSRICFSENEHDLAFAQRDFMRIYEGLCHRTEREMDRIAIEGHAPAGLLPQMKTVDDGTKEIEA